MHTFNRSGVLYCDFYIDLPGATRKKRIRKATGFLPGQEQQAIEFGHKEKLLLERKIKESTGEIKPLHTWGEAVTRFLDEKESDGKISLGNDIQKFCWMDDNIVNVENIKLEKITAHWINKNITAPLKRMGKKKRTINHYLDTVRNVLNRAALDWQDEHGNYWLEKAPKIRREKIDRNIKYRTQTLSKRESEAVASALPDELRAPFLFGQQTGLRSANIAGLKWGKVNFEKKECIVDAYESKNGKPIQVSLSDEAVEILRSRKEVGAHEQYVFTDHRGLPYTYGFSVKEWYIALDQAKIRPLRTSNSDKEGLTSTTHDSGHNYKYTDFTWHDATRHTWATWQALGGTPMEVLRKLGGWSSLEMVDRYAHLSTDYTAQFANNVNKGAEISNQFGSHLD